MSQVFFLAILLMCYYLSRVTSTATAYHHWQCSLPEQENIFSLILQNFEAFDVEGRPDWLIKRRKYVSCYRKGLDEIPQELDGDIEILNLDQNLITRIQKNDFNAYPSLVAISIASNCIQISFYDSTIRRCATEFLVDPEAFVNLPNLKYLSLTGNVMKQLPELLPKSLLILFASFSSIGPIRAVTELTSLAIVSFSANCITADKKNLCKNNFSIENLAFNSEELKHLDLSYNNVKEVPTYLFQSSLVGVKLRGNPIHRIRSEDFLSVENLVFLSLAWTSQYDKRPLRIEKRSFDNLQKLKFLDLSGNMISHLPKNLLANNINLKALNLEFNCLNQIEMNPQVLPLLPQLEELHLSGNRFCSNQIYPLKNIVLKLKLSNAYLRFPKLRVLVLGATDNIPSTVFSSSLFFDYFQHGTKYDNVTKGSLNVLKKLPQLQILSMAVCGIRILDMSAFSGLNLSYLDLKMNQIGETKYSVYFRPRVKRAASRGRFYDYSDFKQRTISPFKRATSSNEAFVILHGNAISDLTAYPMERIQFVTHLILSKNNINYVDEMTFKSLKNLQILDLRNNPIRRIHPNAFLSLKQLSQLSINVTIFQRDIEFDFLSSVQKEDFSFRYGDQGSNFYLLLRSYRKNSVYFPKITRLDTSGVRIPTYSISNNQVIYKPFPSLLHLTIDNAQLTYQPQSNFFQGIEKLITLSMKDCWLEEFPYVSLARLQNLTYLDLSHNYIEVLNNQTFSLNFPPLKTLILTNNYIYKISPGILTAVYGRGLQHLDLSHNQIRHIDPSIVDRQLLRDELFYLDLRGNTINCVCSLGSTFGYLIRSSKLNRSRLPGFFPDCSSSVINYYGGCITCAKSNALAKYPPSLFTYSAMQNCHETLFRTLCLFYSLCFLIFLISSLITTNAFLKEKLITFLLRDIQLQNFTNEENIHLSAKIYAYDGFIFYDKSDFSVGNWVDEILVPKLEKGNPSFRINVVGKEDWCGSTQVEQLLFRMKTSRKTVVILSKNFSSSSPCQYVFSVLEEWRYVNKENKGIIVTYEDFQPSFISKFPRTKKMSCSLLHYSTLKENPLFWVTLKNAMTTL